MLEGYIGYYVLGYYLDRYLKQKKKQSIHHYWTNARILHKIEENASVRGSMKNFKAFLPETIILCIAFLFCMAVWPLGIVQSSHYTSESLERGMFLSAPITVENAAEGSFVPLHSTIDSLSFKFNRWEEIYAVDGSVELELLDSDNTVLFHSSTDMSEIKHNAFHTFPIDCRLNPGEIYKYKLYTINYNYNAPLIYLSSQGVGPIEQKALSMGSIPQSKFAVLKIRYTDRATPRKALPYYASIFFVAILALFACKRDNEVICPILGTFKTVRRFTIYLLASLIVCFLILLGDESRLPVTEEGYEVSTRALDAGTYYMGVEYQTTVPGNYIVITDNGREVLSEELSPSDTYKNYIFTLDKDSQELRVSYQFSEDSDCSIYSSTINTASRFYTDTYYYTLLFAFLCLGVAVFLCKLPTLSISTEKFVIACALVGIALFSFLPYCNGLLPDGNDLCYHIGRIEGIKDGLRDGQFPVYIYPEALNGYGYLNCMYPSLFLYFPAILRLFGVSIVTSYKSLIFVSLLGMSLITYLSVKSIYPNRKAGLLVTLLYMLCPYHLVNVYARGALGEALAMIFLPLCIAGLYHVLLGDQKKWWMLSLGITGLLQTHILSTLLTGILCVIAGLIFFSYIRKEKRWTAILKSVISVLLLNLWFLLPFLYYYFNGGLWLSALETTTYRERALAFSNLFSLYNSMDYRTLSLGLPIVVLTGICIVYLCLKLKHKPAPPDRLTDFTCFLLCTGLVLAFFTLGDFNAWSFMELPCFDWLFKNVQFPSRFLEHSSLLLLAGGVISLFELKVLDKYRRPIALILCAMSLLTVVPYQNYLNYYATKYDTASLSHINKLIGIPRGDYESIYPNEWRREPLDNELLVAESIQTTSPENISINGYCRQGTHTTFNYCATADCQIELPVQFYPGYIAYDETGSRLSITPSENQLISLNAVPDGISHSITLKYQQHPLFILGVLISILYLLFGILRVSRQHSLSKENLH